MVIRSWLAEVWSRRGARRNARAGAYARATAAERRAGAQAAGAWQRPGGPVDPGFVA